MDKSTLSKVWSVVHLACVYAGINAILFLQNSPVTLPLFVNIRDESLRGEGSMALFWAYLAGITFACSIGLALVYLKQFGREGRGVASAPSMFGIGLHHRSSLAGC